MNVEKNETAHSRLLHAIGNAHIDPVWLWRWNEGVEAIRATFQSALDRMEEYPVFIFTVSSAAFFHQLAEVEPDMLDKIRKRIQDGRLEIVGGWWVEPDVNIPSGESLVRQELYGQRWFKDHLGVMADIGYNPDTFGHPRSLPQILKGAGLNFYSFLRPMPNEKDLPGNVFWWEGPDGSRVLASRITRAYCTWFDEMDEHVQMNHEARPDYLSDYTVFYGVGNHGGGPTRKNLDSLIKMKDGDPKVELSSLTRYFQSTLSEIESGAEIPTVADDLQHHARGCYSVHSEVKRLNRKCENLLLSAERFAVMAQVSGRRAYPRALLTEAWRSVLYNQFHDILAGTSLPEGYDDARDLYGHALTLGSEVLHYSIQSIARAVDTRGPGNALLIFNPLPWPMRIPVEIEPSGSSVADAGGTPVLSQQLQPTTTQGAQKRLVFMADLPACGYQLHRQDIPDQKEVSFADSQVLNVTNTSLENDFFRIEVDPETGWIIRLFDKRSDREVLSAPAGVPVVIDDPNDTWSHDVSSYRDEAGRFADAEVSVEESGPVRACLRIEQSWGKSSILQRIYLYRETDTIECRFTVNWQEQYKMLKLAYPLKISDAALTCDAPYGFTEWPPDGEEHPCQMWVDISGSDSSGEKCGFALLNDSKYGFDVLGSELRLSVLRSPVYAHHDPEKLDPEKRYRHIDQGEQDFTVRLVPHSGDWTEIRIVQRAWELNTPPVYVNEYEHEGTMGTQQSFLACDNPDVILTVLKLHEDSGNLIIRGYESTGNAQNARISLPMLDIHWDVELQPHQIKTWLVAPGEEVSRVRETNLLELSET